jgi:hypothetical protein
MRLVAAHRCLAFWGASCLIAFVLSFGLGAVWHARHAPPASALAYAGD